MHRAGEGLVYCFDIDGTLCSLTDGEYALAQPHAERIAHVNRLVEAGHTVKLFTARGSTTGRDWTELTRRQLDEWGVRYHELLFGKPHADLFVDDKAVGADAYPW